MSSFDAEQWFIEIVDLFKDKFNCYVHGINELKQREGSDFIVSEIDSYSLFDITEIGDSPLFISYQFIEQDTNDDLSSAKSIKYTLQFLANFVDNSTAQNELALKHLLRYQRCMLEMINDNFDKFKGSSKMRVEGIPPAVYQLGEENDFIWRNAGINISMVINYG